MSSEPCNLDTDWDCVRNTLSAIRASQREFRESVLGAVEDVERMGDDLLAHELGNEHGDVEQQVAHLTKLIAELGEFVADHKRTTADERANWTKEIRQLRLQVLALREH